jgi:hypothetical protein
MVIVRSARAPQTRDQVLHVRSFLDHDRPFLRPTTPAEPRLVEALDATSDATYVDNADGGKLVRPSEAFFSLVEHWERWAACLGVHGLLVLEVSNLDVVSTRRFMSEATSMHFDCVQAHSGQMLMPATHFSLGAATAGLLPDRHTLTYPKEAAYTRIVLQRLTPGGVKIRLPTLDELPQLLELETFWRSEVRHCCRRPNCTRRRPTLHSLPLPPSSPLRRRFLWFRLGPVSAVPAAVYTGSPCHPPQVLASDESVLRKRLAAHPTGQFVVVAPDGMLLAAMYTQRVPSSKALLTTTRVTELDLHTPHGPVIQLLGVVQRTGALAGSDGRSAGQLLRDYVLHLGRLDATVDQACGGACVPRLVERCHLEHHTAHASSERRGTCRTPHSVPQRGQVCEEGCCVHSMWRRRRSA